MEEQELAESKSEGAGRFAGDVPPIPSASEDGFMTVPEGIDEELPFH